MVEEPGQQPRQVEEPFVSCATQREQSIGLGIWARVTHPSKEHVSKMHIGPLTVFLGGEKGWVRSSLFMSPTAGLPWVSVREKALEFFGFIFHPLMCTCVYKSKVSAISCLLSQNNTTSLVDQYDIVEETGDQDPSQLSYDTGYTAVLTAESKLLLMVFMDSCISCSRCVNLLVRILHHTPLHL